MKEKAITKMEIVFLLLACVLAIFIRIDSPSIPLDRDEGTIAYIADGLGSGMLPYRDTFDHNPPMMYFIFRAGFSIFNGGPDSIRATAGCAVVMTMILIYMFMRMYSGAFLAMLAAFIYAVFQNSFSMRGLGAGSEIFAQFFLVASMLFISDRDNKYGHISGFISGFFAAAAWMTAPITLFFILVPAVYILKYVKNKKRDIIWYASGVIFVFITAISWAAANSIAGEFIDCVFMYDLRNSAGTNFITVFRSVIIGSADYASASLLIVAGVVYAVYKTVSKNNDRLLFLALITFISLYAGIVLFKGAYPHYYLILASAGAIMAAVFIRDLSAYVSKKEGGKIGAIVAAGLLIAGITIHFVAENAYDIVKNGRFTHGIFYESRAMADAINSSKNKDTTVFVWPNEPEIYYLTRTKPPGRFIYSYPLNDYVGEGKQLEQELFLKKPDYFVLENGTEGKFAQQQLGYYKKSVEGRYLTLYRKASKEEKNEPHK